MRPLTPLRLKMIRQMQLERLAPRTQEAYIAAVAGLATFSRCSPEPLRPQPVRNHLARLGHPAKTKWNVRIMERSRHGTGVVTYLARSVRGGPITNARLVAYDGACVTFTYRA